MNSGDSGSLQSSSGGGDGGGHGGDDVFESSFYPILRPPPPPPLAHNHHQPPPTFYDPSSVSSFSSSGDPSPMFNLDSLWSRTARPDSIHTGFGSTLLNSHQDPYPNPSQADPNVNSGAGAEQVGVTTKNPKKRTRASRRAPTTVLTTDTTNFRQMVQEFTGIPAAPFAAGASSMFARRLDPYGGGITPFHPLRPSVQKFQPPYLNSTAATTSNFHLAPSEIHGFPKQPLNLSNFQNPLLSFQSLPQAAHPHEINAPDSDNPQPERSNAFQSSSSTSLKRWRGEDEKWMNFEGGNGDTPNAVVSSRSDGDQVQGNVDSWICPSD